MGNRELPVINFSPFRKYPTRLSQQSYEDESQVCGDCLSGACCTTEHPIYLTSFDVFRLAAFFDLSPATFMLKFTQDRFDGEDSNSLRRPFIQDPSCSIVTYLRRRDGRPSSPCIFLKYVREPDGTPRRVCSVHDARPLSCREYYYNNCKARQTGEVASLFSEGFEKAGLGDFNEEIVVSALSGFEGFDYESASLAEGMEHSFWAEMKLAINMEAANREGANLYDMADYQDPIDEKLNRTLSAKYLRFEEKYGPRPRGEQLIPYSSGLSFAATLERHRIMALVESPPARNLFRPGSYPHLSGVRTMVEGFRPPAFFPTIPAAEADSFLRDMPDSSLFPAHPRAEVRAITLRDIYASILKGLNHLIRFSNRLFHMGNLLEGEPPGRFELDMLMSASGLPTSLNVYLVDNPYLRRVTDHLGGVALEWLERLLSGAATGEEVGSIYRLAATIGPETHLSAAGLPERLMTIIRETKRRLVEEAYVPDLTGEDYALMRPGRGNRLHSERAWRAWSAQVLDAGYFEMAYPGELDLASFYQKTVETLERIPPRRSYALNMYTFIVNLAYSMTFDNRLPYQELPYREAADRLAAQAVRLFHWMEESGHTGSDYWLIAAFPVLYKGLGLGYNSDESFGLIVSRILGGQLADGSWDTNPLPASAPYAQEDYYHRMYYSTWACIDALRPLKGDALNGKNMELGLR